MSLSRLSGVMFSVVFIASGTGCAFKGATAQPEALQSDIGFQVSFDWSPGSRPNPTSHLKAVRPLIATPTGWSAQSPVTLPARTPEELTLSIQIPETALAEPIAFIRSSVTTESRTLSLGTQLIQSGKGDFGKSQIAIQVSGLSLALSADHTDEGGLELEIFSASRKITTIDLKVRTPPSDIEVSTQGLEAWQSLAPTIGEALRSVSIQGKPLSLVRVIEFKHGANKPVELTLPKRTGGRLLQWSNPMTYRDLGCVDAGYAVDSSPRWEPISTDLLILPLDETLITAATEVLDDSSTLGTQVLVVPPGAVKRMGFYAAGESAARWSRNGPERSSLQAITVPGQCYTVCTARECDCTIHCSARVKEFIDGLLRPAEPIPMGCTCSDYDSRRRSATITVGTDRGAVRLEIPATGTGMTVRYGDLDPLQDGETRPITFSPEQSEVSWL